MGIHSFTNISELGNFGLIMDWKALISLSTRLGLNDLDYMISGLHLDLVIHQCPNLNVTVDKLSLQLGHVWTIIPNSVAWIFIHALMPLLIWGILVFDSGHQGKYNGTGRCSTLFIFVSYHEEKYWKINIKYQKGGFCIEIFILLRENWMNLCDVMSSISCCKINIHLCHIFVYLHCDWCYRRIWTGLRLYSIHIHTYTHTYSIHIYIYIESGFGSILLERWCFLSDESDLYHSISLCTLYACVYSKCNDKSHIISMFVWKTSHDLACFIYVNRMCMAKTYF